MEYDIQFETAETIIDSILKEKIELGFIPIHEVSIKRNQIEDEIALHKIGNVPFALAAHKSVDFTNCSQTEIVDKLSKIRMLGPPEEHRHTKLLNEIKKRYKIKSKFMCVDFLSTTIKLMNSGIGWSLIPKHLIRGNLQLVELEDTEMLIGIYFLYNKNEELSIASQKVIELFHEDTINDTVLEQIANQ